MAIEFDAPLMPDEGFEDPEQIEAEAEEDPEKTKELEEKRATGEKRTQARNLRKQNRDEMIRELRGMNSFEYWEKLKNMFGMDEDL